MASDAIAIGALEFLKNSPNYELVCLVSNPDKPKGRGKHLQPNPAAEWALQNGIELLRPEKSPDENVVAKIKELGAEFAIVMAYGCILKDCVLDNLLCLNIHGSILPEFRGASPIETAIALGYKETGVSLMKISKRMDEGDVCAVEKISIDNRDTAKSLREKFSLLSASLLEKNLSSAVDGTLPFIPQDHSKATYTRKFDKSDLYLDFTLSADELDCRIRALGSGWIELDSVQYKVGEAFALADSKSNEVCGKILTASASDGLQVSCSKGILKITAIQKPCAKMLSTKDFFLGNKFEIGSVLKKFSHRLLLK